MKLTTENAGIVLDSTADFPDAADRFPNWRVVPLYVRFGGDSYRDYVDIGPAEFYERLRGAEELPTTSQPTPEDFAAAYEELAGLERVFVLTVSAKLSGTYASAQQAAEETGGRVRVVDTATASAAIAMLGMAIQRRLDQGTTDEEVDELDQPVQARDRPRLHARHARVPREGRSDRSCCRLGGPAPEHQADPHARRRRGAPAEARPRQPQGDPGVRERISRRHR